MRLENRYPRFYAAYIKLGRNQTERAKRLGLSQRAVSYWENGDRVPHIEALQHWPDGIRLLADDIEHRRNRDGISGHQPKRH